jgi:hypothetical protein
MDTGPNRDRRTFITNIRLLIAIVSLDEEFHYKDGHVRLHSKLMTDVFVRMIRAHLPTF